MNTPDSAHEHPQEVMVMHSPRSSAPNLSETFLPSPAVVPSARRPHGQGDAYLLRLCLDLKLDALLLTLGTAASDPACPTSCPPASGSTDLPMTGLLTVGRDADDRLPSASLPPWQRWLHEDVEVTLALARALLTRGGLLPSSMAHAGGLTATPEVLDRLQTCHVELGSLLGEVAQATGTGADSEAASSTVSRLRSGFRHCGRRLDELDLLRAELEEMPPTGGPESADGL
jgi:hypothetical protein